jgi:hypothetical protein
LRATRWENRAEIQGVARNELRAGMVKISGETDDRRGIGCAHLLARVRDMKI